MKKFDIPGLIKPQRKRWLVITIISVVLILLIIFGAKLYLVVNLLLGNDVIIKLDADKELINIVHGEESNVNFKASTITNPFCVAICESGFFDVSGNKTIEDDAFTLRPGISTTKTYKIIAPNLGIGQELYKFSMQCHSVKNILCHTMEIPTIRSTLLTVNYDLNDNEKEIKNNSKIEIENYSLRISSMRNSLESFKHLNFTDVMVGSALDETNGLIGGLTELSNIWKNQDYAALAPMIDSFGLTLAAAEGKFNSLKDRVTGKIEESNKQADEFIRKETLSKEITLDIEYGAICSVTNNCTSRPSIKDIAKETSFNITSACSNIDNLRVYYNMLNASIQNSVKSANYSNSNEFWSNISVIIGNIKQNIINNDYNSIPNEYNKDVLKQILVKRNLSITASYENATPALTLELIKQMPDSCNITIPERVKTPSITPTDLNITLGEQPPQCCIFGICRLCCMDNECRNNPATYPVVFLHGHAFTNSVSAEYTLDGFNKLQKKLEDEGYVNAGVVSLYTEKNEEGIWSKSWEPFSIKASYYYDLFKEPENYVVVQTNSENVDTYAIRLKDIIDTIKFKTGRPKVIIVAHSMGGLVARRYMQIFGSENVAKLIMIAVPNKGITGSTLGYCPLIGEKLECRDMSSGSLLLNKLNRDALPKIPIYNIVGTGCVMAEGIGDGIVLKENGLLEGANNTIIEGKCDGLDILHTSMLIYIDRYTKVYDAIVSALKS
jgi:alpha/beta hydrolase fold